MTALRTLAESQSEASFQHAVIELARLRRWRVVHFRPARTAAGWRTALEGDRGFPDLILARAGRVICAELKAQRGRVSPSQELWLAALGDHGCVWRPSDWDQIEETLR